MQRKTSHYFLDAFPFHFRFACIHSFSFCTLYWFCSVFFFKVKVRCNFTSYFVFFFLEQWEIYDAYVEDLQKQV